MIIKTKIFTGSAKSVEESFNNFVVDNNIAKSRIVSIKQSSNINGRIVIVCMSITYETIS